MLNVLINVVVYNAVNLETFVVKNIYVVDDSYENKYYEN